MLFPRNLPRDQDYELDINWKRARGHVPLRYGVAFYVKGWIKKSKFPDILCCVFRIVLLTNSNSRKCTIVELLRSDRLSTGRKGKNSKQKPVGRGRCEDRN